MRKNNYKAQKINKINIASLKEKVSGVELVGGIDVAKKHFFCNLMTEKKETILTVKWEHPKESAAFVDLLKSLPSQSISTAMEPSGTYGDPLRSELLNAGIPVYKVSPKVSNDAKEIYDGVPSVHDAKSAMIISRLHIDKLSKPWPFKDDRERDLTALVGTSELLRKHHQQDINRFEAQISKYWPGAGEILDIGSASFLELIIKYGDPGSIAGYEEYYEFMKKTGGYFLKDEKIKSLFESAQTVKCVLPTFYEKRELIYLARRVRETGKELKSVKKEIKKLVPKIESAKNMSDVVGEITSAVLVSSAGDPLNYDNPQKYLKSIGLNLKEISSGNKQGGLHITKRGSGLARQYLYFSAMRIVNRDEIIKKWYDKKVKRDSGNKMKALIAVMRKLVLALWHVARGNKFDSSKLFNVKLL